MTAPTHTLEWEPVLVFASRAENCCRCKAELDSFGMITLGAKDQGPVCQDCAEALAGIGEPMWQFAEALDKLDYAIYQLPQMLRPGAAGRAIESVQKILEWRIGPTTPEDTAKYIAEAAAAGKMLRLPGKRYVKAADYDPEKHGPIEP